MNTETLLNDIPTSQLEQILAQRQQQEQVEKAQKRTAYEQLKEDTVMTACTRAIELSSAMAEFKEQIFGDCQTLYGLLQEYSSRHADGDGNFKIVSKDAQYKLEYSRQNLGFFDERSAQAEQHIIEFVNRQFSGDAATKKLIMLALERNAGKLDLKQVQKLYAMENDFEDFNWKEGIRLFKESWTPSESKDYIRFYQKVKSAWQLINLNFSSIK